MSPTPNEALHANIHGRVQGVGFRYSTVAQAKRLGLTGYTRNMPDGSVEVVAEGEKRKLEALLAWLRKGPSMARVSDVQHRFVPPVGTYRGFGVDY